jgi:quercetin dioxygenase-like cupin family protein
MEPNGTLVRYIDFAPGAASNPHRALCIGYGVVLEGTLELELDSGEKRLLQRGDISVNRATVHTWTNMSKTEPARVLFFLLPIEPLKVNGKIVGQEMGRLGESYKK